MRPDFATIAMQLRISFGLFTFTKPPVKVGCFFIKPLFFHLSADANLILEKQARLIPQFVHFPVKSAASEKCPED